MLHFGECCVSVEVLKTIAFSTVILWCRLLLQFLIDWRKRGNPKSLAIAQVICFCMFIGVVQVDSPVWYVIVVNLVVCLSFHILSEQADRKFINRRERP